MHTERYVGTFVDHLGRDITIVAWATSTTKQNARRKVERFFRCMVREQTTQRETRNVAS